ncbi:MAG: carbohydrate binding domain-containing protein [Clostridia bacterium]|nr:carbohydrate binding domain-containing protein [Clostridia bacterium]
MKKILSMVLTLTLLVTTLMGVMIVDVNAVSTADFAETIKVTPATSTTPRKIEYTFGVSGLPAKSGTDRPLAYALNAYATGEWWMTGYTYDKVLDPENITNIDATGTYPMQKVATVSIVNNPLDPTNGGDMSKIAFEKVTLKDDTYKANNSTGILKNAAGTEISRISANYFRLMLMGQDVAANYTGPTTNVTDFSKYDSFKSLAKANIETMVSNGGAYVYTFYAYTNTKSVNNKIMFKSHQTGSQKGDLYIPEEYVYSDAAATDSSKGIPHKVQFVLSGTALTKGNLFYHLYVDGVEKAKGITNTSNITGAFQLSLTNNTNLSGSSSMNFYKADWYVSKAPDSLAAPVFMTANELKDELIVVPNLNSATQSTTYRTDDYITGVNSYVEPNIKAALESTTSGDKYAEVYESAYNDVTKLVDTTVANPTVKLVNRTTGAEVSYANASGSLDNYYLKVKGVYITPVKGEDIEIKESVIKTVKSAANDPNGMLFNIACGSTTSGIEASGHIQFNEDGTPKYDTYLKTATNPYFGNVLQYDIMTTTANKNYRLPFNLKYGDTFGRETLTNLANKFLYVSYYIKSVPDINGNKNGGGLNPAIAIRDTSTKKDVTVLPSGLKNITMAYNENWTKYEGTLDVNTTTLGSYTLPNSYGSYGGVPMLRFTLGAGPYSFQMADVNVAMFDSEETYNAVKDISALKSLSVNGETLDVTKNSFEVVVDDEVTLANIKDTLQYTAAVDCNRVDVTMPESLPGYIKITSYALSADATNTAETKKTEYSIYVKTKKISKFEMSADFKAGKAEVSATIVEPKNADVYMAYYNQAGRMIKISKHYSPYTGESRTVSATENIPADTVKVKAFVMDTNQTPILPSIVRKKAIVAPEFISNGTFEDGTYKGWTTNNSNNKIVNEGHNSNYSFKVTAGVFEQDITSKVQLAEQGFYYFRTYAKSLNDDDTNVRMYIEYRLAGDTANRQTGMKTLLVGPEWTELNYIAELSEYIVNDDGTETLNVNSEKEVTFAKLVITVYQNSGKPGFLVDDISVVKVGNLDGTSETKLSKPSVFLLSDSLGQDYDTRSFPRQGWAYNFRDFFTDDVNYFNFAASGWSTRTFVQGVLSDGTFTRPVWHRYKTAIKEGDYVIVSLGHNDVGSGTKKTTPEEYKANLKTIVDDTRKAGGNVIFVTNAPNVHPNLEYSYKVGIYTRYQEVFVPYAEELGVPCINMNLAMTDMEKELFKDESYLASYKNARAPHQQAIYLYNLADNGFIESDSQFNYSINDDTLGVHYDPTHIQYRGAQYIADFVAKQFVVKNLDIKDYITVNDTQLISNGGFEVGLYDWTVPEARTFKFTLPEGAPQEYDNNFGTLTTTGTISQNITIPLKANGGKKYTLSADVTTTVTVAVKVNGNTVATATISPTTKTAVLDLTSVSNPATAVIEFTSATECVYDNISLK